MIRARVVGWRVQPILMADDGENLTPVPVDPVDIPAARWEDFKSGGDLSALDNLRAKIEEESTANADNL